MSTYTRNDVAKAMAERLQISQANASVYVDWVLGLVSTALREGKRVEFRNFGVFEVVTRKPKIGRNPSKPEQGSYLIPERKAVIFRTGKTLSDKLNQPTQ